MVGSHLLGGPTLQPWWNARSCQGTWPGTGHAGAGNRASLQLELTAGGLLDRRVCSGSSCGSVTITGDDPCENMADASCTPHLYSSRPSVLTEEGTWWLLCVCDTRPALGRAWLSPCNRRVVNAS